MRRTVSFKVDGIQKFKAQTLQWSHQFHESLWLDSNGHSNRHSSFESLLAIDALTVLQTDAVNAFDALEEYQARVNDWLFGYLSYDLKNDVEQLDSSNPDRLQFPELYFFQPKKIIRIRHNAVDFIYLKMVEDEIELDFRSIMEGDFRIDKESDPNNALRIRMGIFKDEYFKRVRRMLDHIHRGDIYEANFCQEFYAEDIQINALRSYQKLNAISKPPFACFLRFGDKYVLSASPERYLRKHGNKVVSQPIKGTARRSKDDVQDESLKASLANDTKERAENIMIVDLVRNDLSKSALRGSVKVEELCGVYSFEQVHQMISTISAEVAESQNPVALIRETFPMGSMTGAPKVSAMKIIEELEAFKRGLYSGTVGYFTPDGDFDFNVVIRSILYHETKKKVSFSVGSAITAKAIPEKEYEECLLKAKAMREVLEG
ncbi:anthranilate synthase component I family protein [Flavobacteriaceae bacterium TP-CH-4]|uniref:Anthranilate synthase component I family protein n=1 Tax=Pelagihabitans pacificus TaxID=2696054 RepID=A0A967AVH3_9FLAO|nr:anthranilate synthase component I family protein [Pelagihabitans pacificus]NHF59818.1 anthranilate synthase component I family protein [Pelagihabitans pacificus]